MKKMWKRYIALVAAVMLVISGGIFSSDRFLRATDGTENVVEEQTTEEGSVDTAELAAEQVVTIEQGVFEDEAQTDVAEETEQDPADAVDSADAQDADAEAEQEAEESDPADADAAEEVEATEAVEETEATEAVEETEATEAVEETEATESTEIPETEEPAEERTVTITSNVSSGTTVSEPTEVTLTAELTGHDNVPYTLQWQRKPADADWEDIEGATDLTYTFTLNEENSGYSWRVAVTAED